MITIISWPLVFGRLKAVCNKEEAAEYYYGKCYQLLIVIKLHRHYLPSICYQSANVMENCY
jgi:hypothetical protein